MKKHKILITLAGLVVAVATTATVAAYTLAGDGSSPPANESVGTQEPAFPGGQIVRVGPGTGELIDPLLATGAQVEVTGEVVSEGIFSVDGTIILVNGERVQVMDFGDAAALEAQAAGISPTGSSIATHGQASMVLWVAPPHFFRTDTAIVLYVGENSEVIAALTSVLGPQFAGR